MVEAVSAYQPDGLGDFDRHHPPAATFSSPIHPARWKGVEISVGCIRVIAGSDGNATRVNAGRGCGRRSIAR
jgi:hypothetical protein